MNDAITVGQGQESRKPAGRAHADDMAGSTGAQRTPTDYEFSAHLQQDTWLVPYRFQITAAVVSLRCVLGGGPTHSL